MAHRDSGRPHDADERVGSTGRQRPPTTTTLSEERDEAREREQYYRRQNEALTSRLLSGMQPLAAEIGELTSENAALREQIAALEAAESPRRRHHRRKKRGAASPSTSGKLSELRERVRVLGLENDELQAMRTNAEEQRDRMASEVETLTMRLFEEAQEMAGSARRLALADGLELRERINAMVHSPSHSSLHAGGFLSAPSSPKGWEGDSGATAADAPATQYTRAPLERSVSLAILSQSPSGAVDQSHVPVGVTCPPFDVLAFTQYRDEFLACQTHKRMRRRVSGTSKGVSGSSVVGGDRLQGALWQQCYRVDLSRAFGVGRYHSRASPTDVRRALSRALLGGFTLSSIEISLTRGDTEGVCLLCSRTRDCVYRAQVGPASGVLDRPCARVVSAAISLSHTLHSEALAYLDAPGALSVERSFARVAHAHTELYAAVAGALR